MLFFCCLSPVGAPIPVEKMENPSKADIEALHKLYVEKLVELFDTQKTKYGISADQKLTISWRHLAVWKLKRQKPFTDSLLNLNWSHIKRAMASETIEPWIVLWLGGIVCVIWDMTRFLILYKWWKSKDIFQIQPACLQCKSCFFPFVPPLKIGQRIKHSKLYFLLLSYVKKKKSFGTGTFCIDNFYTHFSSAKTSWFLALKCQC